MELILLTLLVVDASVVLLLLPPLEVEEVVDNGEVMVLDAVIGDTGEELPDDGTEYPPVLGKLV